MAKWAAVTLGLGALVLGAMLLRTSVPPSLPATPPLLRPTATDRAKSAASGQPVALSDPWVPSSSQPASPPVSAGGIASNEPAGTPGLAKRPISVYAVTNPNDDALDVLHVFSGSSGFIYTYWSRVPAGGTVEYHLRDIPQVPSPFDGRLDLYASSPLSATITGSD